MKTSFIFTRIVLPMVFSILIFNTSNAQKMRYNEQKKDVTPLSNVTEDLLRLQPVTYSYVKKQTLLSGLSSGTHFGLIAEDVEKVFPQLVKVSYKSVSTGKNSYKSVPVKTIDYNSLIPLLVGAIKEQQVDIETLKSQLQKLSSI